MLRRLALAALLALAPSLASAQFATIGPTPAVTDNGDRLATTNWVNLFFATGLPLANGKIFIGSAGGLATQQTMSGDCTLVASGVITCTQAAGNFQVIGSLTVGGSIIDGSGILATNIVAPATPAAGTTRIYVDSTTKIPTGKNDAGTLSNMVTPITCSAAQWVSAIAANAAVSCSAIPANSVTRTMEAQGVARSVIGVTGNATANVADIQGTASQFLGVNSGGTALAFQTMSGDATLSGAAITVTKVNGVDQTASWTTYTPTVTSGGGTITTSSATGRYRQIGKTIILEAFVTITTAGTGAGQLLISLPVNSAAFSYVGIAKESASTGKSGACQVVGGTNATVVQAIDSTGTTFIASGAAVNYGITYETP